MSLTSGGLPKFASTRGSATRLKRARWTEETMVHSALILIRSPVTHTSTGNSSSRWRTVQSRIYQMLASVGESGQTAGSTMARGEDPRHTARRRIAHSQGSRFQW